MGRLVLLFLLVFGFLRAADAIYFMPYEQKQALDVLLKTIDSSRANVEIAIYSFTNRQIAKAIRDAAKRGVKIRIVYDWEANAKNNHSTIGYLSKYKNVQTCLLKGKRAKNGKYDGIMHQKLAIIDDDAIIIGSANWSKNAFENNYELLVKSEDKAMIAKAKKYFDETFEKCKPY